MIFSLLFVWVLGYMYTLGVVLSSPYPTDSWKDLIVTWLVLIVVWPIILGGLHEN